ncbi:uncharacterized protein LOC129757061 [Uranotaenia lowii]|uniref:uncharacterized protein LOC129757061 n=1 Tax=Uranotaenia lowii TaxID=190385 RepID=UPI0024796E43|nr:uncharacterized protein LOC129757061 [Uranotaenia lowii]
MKSAISCRVLGKRLLKTIPTRSGTWPGTQEMFPRWITTSSQHPRQQHSPSSSSSSSAASTPNSDSSSAPPAMIVTGHGYSPSSCNSSGYEVERNTSIFGNIDNLLRENSMEPAGERFSKSSEERERTPAEEIDAAARHDKELTSGEQKSCEMDKALQKFAEKGRNSCPQKQLAEEFLRHYRDLHCASLLSKNEKRIIRKARYVI